MRASGLGIAVNLASKIQGCLYLSRCHEDLPGTLWTTILAIVTDHSECSVVRKQVIPDKYDCKMKHEQNSIRENGECCLIGSNVPFTGSPIQCTRSCEGGYKHLNTPGELVLRLTGWLTQGFSSAALSNENT